MESGVRFRKFTFFKTCDPINCLPIKTILTLLVKSHQRTILFYYHWIGNKKFLMESHWPLTKLSVNLPACVCFIRIKHFFNLLNSHTGATQDTINSPSHSSKLLSTIKEVTTCKYLSSPSFISELCKTILTCNWMQCMFKAHSNDPIQNLHYSFWAKTPLTWFPTFLFVELSDFCWALQTDHYSD